jgi:predicted GTPase
MEATGTAFKDAEMTRDEFLNCFVELENQFEQRKEEARYGEHEFFAALSRCHKTAQEHPLAGSKLKQNNALRELIDEQAQRIRKVFGQWERTIHDRHKRAEFKKRKADSSLLVFVYGKVKAGKSSLGNYVAWGWHDPTADAQQGGQTQPQYFVETSQGLTEHISEGEIRERRKFKVGSTETTSAIQGFTLPGLTWVDSPGLHSKNKENGELAQQYVDAADLVLYLTNSAAPCKRSDVMELKELGRKEHNLAVLITNSDMFEEDEDDDGNLVKVRTMKSAHDRASQVEYTRQTLAEQGEGEGTDATRIMASTLRRAKVFSVSVAYAEEHPGAQGIAESGIGHMLHDVALLAKSDGVRAKLIQPLKNLRSFLHEIRDRDLADLHKRLDDCIQGVEKARSEARRKALSDCHSIAMAIGAQIDVLVSRHTMDDAAFQRSVRQAYGQWVRDGMVKATRAYESTMETSLPEALDDVMRAVPGFETKTLQVTHKRNLRAKQGAVVGALLLGGAATFLTGGLAAVALGVGGSMLGGLMGRGVGGMLDVDEFLDVPVGDNALQVGSTTRKLIRESFDAHMLKVIDGLDVVCFEDLAQWISQVQAQARNVEDRTCALLQDIDSRIAAHGSVP